MLEEAGAPGRGVWPLTPCPGGRRIGTTEVVFQHLAAREPFTDSGLRAELLRRLNELKGVDIPEGKPELRPNFRLALLKGDDNRELLAETLRGSAIAGTPGIQPEESASELGSTNSWLQQLTARWNRDDGLPFRNIGDFA
ncbi:hypothetical protein [Streptomyces sp. NPDC002540]